MTELAVAINRLSFLQLLTQNNRPQTKMCFVIPFFGQWLNDVCLDGKQQESYLLLEQVFQILGRLGLMLKIKNVNVFVDESEVFSGNYNDLGGTG